MTTQEQQQQIEHSHRDAIEQLRIENEHSDEYFNRKFHWKIDFVGKLHVPTKIQFHPNHFHGTEFELDSIIVKYLRGKEDEFKITGVHRFDTAVELSKKYPLSQLRNHKKIN